MRLQALARSAAFLCGLWSKFEASAQVGYAYFQWEVSTDQGVRWSAGDVSVAPSQTSVLVRAKVTWTADAGVAWVVTGFDGVVGNLSAGDIVYDVTPGHFVHLPPAARPRPLRIGNLVKLDPEGDADPPGEGPLFYRAGADPLNDLTQPIVLLTAVLHLNGVPGRRTLSQAFSYVYGWEHPGQHVALRVGAATYNYPATLVSEGAVVVVPGPGSIALSLPALMWAGGRRRRA